MASNNPSDINTNYDEIVNWNVWRTYYHSPIFNENFMESLVIVSGLYEYDSLENLNLELNSKPKSTGRVYHYDFVLIMRAIEKTKRIQIFTADRIKRIRNEININPVSLVKYLRLCENFNTLSSLFQNAIYQIPSLMFEFQSRTDIKFHMPLPQIVDLCIYNPTLLDSCESLLEFRVTKFEYSDDKNLGYILSFKNLEKLDFTNIQKIYDLMIKIHKIFQDNQINNIIPENGIYAMSYYEQKYFLMSYENLLRRLKYNLELIKNKQERKQVCQNFKLFLGFVRNELGLEV